MVWLLGLALAKPLVLASSTDVEGAVQRVAEVTGRSPGAFEGQAFARYASGLPVRFDGGLASGCYTDAVPTSAVVASLETLQRPAVVDNPAAFVDAFHRAEAGLPCLQEPLAVGAFFFAKGRHRIAQGDGAGAMEAFRDARSMGYAPPSVAAEVAEMWSAVAVPEGRGPLRIQPYPERVWVDGVLVTHDADGVVEVSRGRHLITVQGTRTTSVDVRVDQGGTVMLPAIYDGRLIEQLDVPYRERALAEILAMGAGRAYLSDGVNVWKGSVRGARDLAGSAAPRDGVRRRPGDDMVCLPGGTFLQGEDGGDRRSSPQHLTYVSGFCMADHPVTQAEYLALSGQAPSRFRDCPDCPVENVSWRNAVDYANALSRSQGLRAAYDGGGNRIEGAPGWRLPTEAEWEYAARGGEPHRFAGSNDPRLVAWTEADRTDALPGRPHPVCTKARNAFGLCDLSGNVAEWVGDWSGAYPQDGLLVVNPLGPEQGDFRVVRGGSFAQAPEQATVVFRSFSTPTDADPAVGFRLVRSAP